MNKNELFSYIKNTTPQQMIRDNNKARLQEMYKMLYGLEPNKYDTKERLTYKCWDFVQDQIRTDDLFKLLK